MTESRIGLQSSNHWSLSPTKRTRCRQHWEWRASGRHEKRAPQATYRRESPGPTRDGQVPGGAEMACGAVSQWRPEARHSQSLRGTAETFHDGGRAASHSVRVAWA